MWFPRIPEFNEGGDERWLITYADMITLLLVLFIILYSTANADLEKFLAMMDSLSEGAGDSTRNAPTGIFTDGGISIHSGSGESPINLFPENQIPIDIFQFYEILNGTGEASGATGDQTGAGAEGVSDVGLLEALRGLVQEAEQAGIDEGLIPEEGIGADVEVTFNERGINIVIFPADILFDSGSARLKPAFADILARLYDPLSRLPNKIEIQGHTDSIPISTATYPSNWELSAGRAGSVIRQLESLGLAANRLQAAGYADTVPVASNSTREGRAMNRRVELLILRGVFPNEPDVLEVIGSVEIPEAHRSEDFLESVGREFGADGAPLPPENSSE